LPLQLPIYPCPRIAAHYGCCSDLFGHEPCDHSTVVSRVMKEKPPRAELSEWREPTSNWRMRHAKRVGPCAPRRGGRHYFSLQKDTNRYRQLRRERALLNLRRA
jgi:hypothetical protein